MDASSAITYKDWVTAALLNAAAVFAVWELIELGLVRGTTRANRYGEDPIVLRNKDELALVEAFSSGSVV